MSSNRFCDTTPAAAAAPVPKSAKSPRSRSGDTAQKINQIVDAMIHWNSSQQDNQRRLRISIPPVKALASCIGANYQATIQQVLKDRESELNELHARLLLGVRHNIVNGSRMSGSWQRCGFASRRWRIVIAS